MAKQQQPSNQRTTVLKLRDVITLHGAYSALDETKQGDTTTRNVFNGVTAYRIAKNIATTKPIVDNYTTARNLIIKQYASSEKPNEVAPENVADFVQREIELLDETTDVSIVEIDYNDLLNTRGDVSNVISVNALSVLLPFLTNTPE